MLDLSKRQIVLKTAELSDAEITATDIWAGGCLDFSKTWTDAELCERYRCSAAERKMIESMIRPFKYVVHNGKQTTKKTIFAEAD